MLDSSRLALQRGLGIAAEDRADADAIGQQRRLASTGPQHRCRGSTASRRPRTLRRTSFNGASASLPRIGPGLRAAHASRGSFNGASASLPRIGSRSSAPRPSPDRFNGASASLPRIGTLPTREGPRRTSFNGASASLPRIGRRRRRRDGVRWPFNGASASLPRIDAVEKAAALVVGIPSTGPQHRFRGSVLVAMITRMVERPSTGPQHRCRGSM